LALKGLTTNVPAAGPAAWDRFQRLEDAVRSLLEIMILNNTRRF
jgi:hypothetical protein